MKNVHNSNCRKYYSDMSQLCLSFPLIFFWKIHSEQDILHTFVTATVNKG